MTKNKYLNHGRYQCAYKSSTDKVVIFKQSVANELKNDTTKIRLAYMLTKMKIQASNYENDIINCQKLKFGTQKAVTLDVTVLTQKKSSIYNWTNRSNVIMWKAFKAYKWEFTLNVNNISNADISVKIFFLIYKMKMIIFTFTTFCVVQAPYQRKNSVLIGKNVFANNPLINSYWINLIC